MTGPLHGFRILDISSVIMGPYGTQILGDMGADVIVVEPVSGRTNRDTGTTVAGGHPEFSGIALNLLRNKRSISVDLKDPSARAAMLKVVAGCDVVVTNLRPKPLARLGFAYNDLKAVRDDIILCQAQGFRTDGPRADDPAYDDIIQAESGLADCFIRAGYEPTLLPTIAADKLCGLTIANAVMAALLHRSRTGRGQRIEVPMLDVMRAFVMVEHGSEAVAQPPRRAAGYARILTTARRPQKTKDGWVNILPYEGEAYDQLFAAGGLDELVGDPRTQSKATIVANADFLYGRLQTITPQRTTQEWLDFCKERRIPVGSVSDLDGILETYPVENHPVAGPYRAIPAPVWFTDAPTGLRDHAPRLGQNSVEILVEAGLTPAEIDGLVASGAVKVPTDAAVA